MFIFLPLFVISERKVLIGSSVCTCNSSLGLCDSPCSIGIRKVDRLPKCPSTPFQQSIPLVDWLLKEMFCVYSDHRGIKLDSYNNSFDDNDQFLLSDNPFDASNLSDSTTGQTYNYKQAIKGDNGTIYIPSLSSLSIQCQTSARPIEFLVPVKSQCYYNYNTTDQESIWNINMTDGFTNIFNETEGDNNDNNYIEVITSLDYVFTYNKAREIIQKYLTITRANISDDSPEMVRLDTSVKFYLENQAPNVFKAGEFGYASSQPLIVKRNSSAELENFPVPFGVECDEELANMKFTPLLFGEDTMSGCNNSEDATSIKELLLNYTHISKLGQASPTMNGDWIQVRKDNLNESCGNYLKLIISYEFIGNVNNPQRRIFDARYECLNLSTSNFIFSAEFLKTANNPAARYLPRSPVKGIPPDTFYPMK